MIQTADFKTKNEVLKKDMPRITGNNQFKSKTIVAIDGGYSGIKGVSPNKLFAFPSYAKKAPRDFSIVSDLKSDDLFFRDNKTGEIWLVGRTAEALMNQEDIDSTSDSTLYTRYRYNSDVYKVLMTCGVALGLYGLGAGAELYLQTGLPSEYLERDADKLKKALVGNFDVALKLGNHDWVNFQFHLNEEHIDVMEQPKGTLNALVYDMGKVCKEGASLLNKNVLILDIGFGTEDKFGFKSGVSTNHDTTKDTAMRAVFEDVSHRLRKKNPDLDVKVFEFQKYLEEGTIPFFNEDTYGMSYEPFAEMLEVANKELSDKSIERLMRENDNLKDYHYLVVTGGTGESRLDYIKEKLKGLPKLSILAGNKNTPDVSCIYSNVIGYYMFRYALLVRELKKAGYVQEEAKEA